MKYVNPLVLRMFFLLGLTVVSPLFFTGCAMHAGTSASFDINAGGGGGNCGAGVPRPQQSGSSRYGRVQCDQGSGEMVAVPHGSAPPPGMTFVGTSAGGDGGHGDQRFACNDGSDRRRDCDDQPQYGDDHPDMMGSSVQWKTYKNDQNSHPRQRR